MVHAQDNQGEIQEEEVIIRKGKKIKLPPVNRNYKKIKIRPPAAFEQSLDLKFRTANIGLSPLDPAIRIKTTKPEPLAKLYPVLVKAGAGNYATSNFELYWENKRNKNTGIGFFIDHLASARGPGEDPESSGESHNKVGVFGEYAFGNSLGVSKLGYQRDQLNFYGTIDDPLFDPILIFPTYNTYNRFFVIAGIKSYDQASYWAYDFGLDYRYTDDVLGNKEHWIRSVFGLNNELDPGLKIGMDLGFSFSQYQQSILPSFSNSYSRTVIEATPYMKKEEDRYSLKAGIRVAYESDTLLQNELHLYPVGLFTYHVLPEKLDLYTGVDGRPEIQSFSQASEDNQWLYNSYLSTSNLVLNLFGGVRGKLGSKLWYDLNLKYQTIDRLPMFVNVYGGPRFAVLYENGNSTLLQLEGLFTWQMHRKLSFDFEGRLINYSMATQARPWHLPSRELKIKANYFIREKLMLKLGFLYLDGIYGRLSFGGETRLDAIYDVGLGLEYFVSKRFTLFSDFNNLLGKNYQRYLNYRVKGFNFIAGASYSF
jgi:hypothetical protein